MSGIRRAMTSGVGRLQRLPVSRIEAMRNKAVTVAQAETCRLSMGTSDASAMMGDPVEGEMGHPADRRTTGDGGGQGRVVLSTAVAADCHACHDGDCVRKVEVIHVVAQSHQQRAQTRFHTNVPCLHTTDEPDVCE